MSEPRRRPRTTTLLHLVALVVGAVALGLLIAHLGWAGLRRVVVDTGAWFAALAVIDVASIACDALALHAFLDGEVAYRHAFAAEASGLAINRLTPGNALGEPVKVTLLSHHVVAERAVAAVALFNLATLYVSLAALALSLPLTALLIDLPRAAAIAAWSGLLALLVLAGAVAALVRRGALATLLGGAVALHLLPAGRAAAWRGRVAAIDQRLRGLGDARARSVRRGLLGVALSRLCAWAGTVIVLHAAGLPLRAPLIVATLAFGILISGVTNLVPLGLGVADGSNYLLYQLLGASPEAGLVFTMIGRVRTCVQASLGLGIMAVAALTRGRRPPPLPPPSG
jgi:hypothetical protein